MFRTLLTLFASIAAFLGCMVAWTSPLAATTVVDPEFTQSAYVQSQRLSPVDPEFTQSAYVQSQHLHKKK